MSVSTLDDEIFLYIASPQGSAHRSCNGKIALYHVLTCKLNHNAINVYLVFITIGLHYALNTI